MTLALHLFSHCVPIMSVSSDGLSNVADFHHDNSRFCSVCLYRLHTRHCRCVTSFKTERERNNMSEETTVPVVKMYTSRSQEGQRECCCLP